LKLLETENKSVNLFFFFAGSKLASILLLLSQTPLRDRGEFVTVSDEFTLELR
jgi:hypothetical protein